jgi:hypothetical protein
MTDNHCMIDIETLGRDYNSVVVSVGAVMFDAENGVHEDATFYEEIDPVSCQEHGLTIDAGTLGWWLTENLDEAPDVIPGGRKLERVLTDFNRFYARNNVDAVWAKSPIFDLQMLETAFDVTDKRTPWSFWETRDVRTFLTIDDVETDSETAHNALDDAIAQAESVATIARLNEIEL